MNSQSNINTQNDNVWDTYHFDSDEKSHLNNLLVQYSDNNKSKKRKTMHTPPKKSNKSKSNKSRSNKRQKINDSMLGWVSATKTKNYLLDDQSVDWLKMYYNEYGLSFSDEKKSEINIDETDYMNILMENGNIFEEKIYDYLKNEFDREFVLVMDRESMENFRNEKTINGLIRTKNNYVKKLMDKGIPIIAQAPIINDNNMSYGVADLLVRSDYIKKLFRTFEPDDEINIKAPKLKMKKKFSYHYRVIDCKWTTMTLCIDGVTIRNEGLFPAYKGQLAVYTAGLESLQGYIPNYAYIMAKAWKIGKSDILPEDLDKYVGYSAFDRPGIINYSGKDQKYVDLTKNAIKWMQTVMTVGNEWRYNEDSPTVPELYPNVNKSFNPGYDKIKSVIAHKYGDPTLVWYVGSKHRKIAHKNGIYDIHDPECTIDKLGINPDGRGQIIKKILEINNSEQKDNLLLPKKIKNKKGKWHKENDLDYYVDFETINYNLFADPTKMDINNSFNSNISDVTFMIGYGFKHNKQINTEQIIESLCINKEKCSYYLEHDEECKWEFVCLFLSRFDLASELEMFRLFFQFILVRERIYQKINTKSKTPTKMFHWTRAEHQFMKRAIDRIRQGEYTHTYMDNHKMNFSDNNIKTVQNELDILINKFEEQVSWIDMCEIFQSEPIVVKGSYRFKLKHIAQAMHKHKMIKTSWDNEGSKMSDGFRAMMEAIIIYKNNDSVDNDNTKMMDIIKYNQIDCKTVFEIVGYLRKHHI